MKYLKTEKLDKEINLRRECDDNFRDGSKKVQNRCTVIHKSNDSAFVR